MHTCIYGAIYYMVALSTIQGSILGAHDGNEKLIMFVNRFLQRYNEHSQRYVLYSTYILRQCNDVDDDNHCV